MMNKSELLRTHPRATHVRLIVCCASAGEGVFGGRVCATNSALDAAGGGTTSTWACRRRESWEQLRAGSDRQRDVRAALWHVKPFMSCCQCECGVAAVNILGASATASPATEACCAQLLRATALTAVLVLGFISSHYLTTFRRRIPRAPSHAHTPCRYHAPAREAV